jgi:hypothetical protein
MVIDFDSNFFRISSDVFLNLNDSASHHSGHEYDKDEDVSFMSNMNELKTEVSTSSIFTISNSKFGSIQVTLESPHPCVPLANAVNYHILLSLV